MFFVLYALGLIVLTGGIALGLPMSAIIAIYATVAVMLSAWVGHVRARRLLTGPPRERRRSAMPLQPTHW